MCIMCIKIIMLRAECNLNYVESAIKLTNQSSDSVFGHCFLTVNHVQYRAFIL